MAKIILVNEKDEVIGSKERNDRDGNDIIRVSGVWVFNSAKEVLIAQRSLDKAYDPGKWGPSVAGTLEEGETYASNAIKEAKEEIGLSLAEKDLIPGAYRFAQTKHKYFYQSFFVKADIPIEDFAFQEEVEQLRWIPIDILLEWVSQKPDDFIESFRTPESSLYSLSAFLKDIY